MNIMEQDSRVVLLPAIADLQLTDSLKRYFEKGGRTILLGEERTEYVDRRMNPVRIAGESEAAFKQFADDLRTRVGKSLIALDQEPAGILRLHKLVPKMPSLEDFNSMSDNAIERICREIAIAARGIGVSMFLSPIVDVVSGQNIWLRNRTLGIDPVEVARIASACTRGFEGGGILATAKHFPGHHDIDADPALAIAEVSGPASAFEPGFAPFKAVIEAGVGAIMLGPAFAPSIDPTEPSSTSKATVDLLRGRFKFNGLVVSDDLDSPATMRGRSLEETAIASLNAGVDLMLVAAGDHIEDLSKAIQTAVENGKLKEERLADAATRVRSLLV